MGLWARSTWKSGIKTVGYCKVDLVVNKYSFIYSNSILPISDKRLWVAYNSKTMKQLKQLKNNKKYLKIKNIEQPI